MGQNQCYLSINSDIKNSLLVNKMSYRITVYVIRHVKQTAISGQIRKKNKSVSYVIQCLNADKI